MCEEAPFWSRKDCGVRRILEAFFLALLLHGEKDTAWLWILTAPLILLFCASPGICIPMWHTNVRAPHAFPSSALLSPLVEARQFIRFWRRRQNRIREVTSTVAVSIQFGETRFLKELRREVAAELWFCCHDLC